MDEINIEGLDRAEILAALYNKSQQQGMGFLDQRGAKGMTKEMAAELLKNQDYFDYLQGRVMKISLKEGAKTLRPFLYDRDNGQGAAARVIAKLRAA